MCGSVKHDEHGNHIGEEAPATEAPINVTREFETATEAPVEEVAEEVEA